jgi:hypothetical protein
MLWSLMIFDDFEARPMLATDKNIGFFDFLNSPTANAMGS